MLGRSFCLCSRSCYLLTWPYASDGLMKFPSLFWGSDTDWGCPNLHSAIKVVLIPEQKETEQIRVYFYNWTSGIVPSCSDGEVPSNLITETTVSCLSQSLNYYLQCSEPPWPPLFSHPSRHPGRDGCWECPAQAVLSPGLWQQGRASCLHCSALDTLPAPTQPGMGGLFPKTEGEE